MALNDKHYLSADEYLRDTWRLAAAVKESGWQPDILIALWRGGAPVSSTDSSVMLRLSLIRVNYTKTRRNRQDGPLRS